MRIDDIQRIYTEGRMDALDEQDEAFDAVHNISPSKTIKIGAKWPSV